ncbi:Mur ligase [Neolentinus lepideus HHB14362 ss-1]|uniref:Mur ligase n=1 Tax=Neolentinus lepideus HHB14362 ss-1 TaxID=1314782 RepID=A0A165UL90_9AGAM|nr:Mur ligase [Neolentinus lepideus HHB14362 ss-1]
MSIDLTLDRIRKLLSHLPPYTRPTVHIAGTNGKGSVSALVSSILHMSSPPMKVGRFNSPHLVSVHDSIAINGQPVSPETYLVARVFVEEMDRKHSVKASSFEWLTSTALLIFEQEQVDMVVLEVGMGGRLDATNVVPDECIVVSALTAVDLDHQAFLGDTPVAIAKEKAAIARPGKPFVFGPQKYPEVEGAVRTAVGLVGGQLIYATPAVSREWNEDIDGPMMSLPRSSFSGALPTPVDITLPCFPQPLHALLPLHGEHQLSNLGVALHIISALISHPSSSRSGETLQLRQRLTPATVSRGIRSVSWPGRLSWHDISVQTSNNVAKPLTILADGAHNPASSATLAAYISSLISASTERCSLPREVSVTYILALSDSPPKTPLQTLEPLLSPVIRELSSTTINVNVAVLRFTAPDGMPWIKAVSPSALRNTVSLLAPNAKIWSISDDEKPDQEQLLAALQWAESVSGSGEGDERLVVLAGSLYLVADFYRLIRGGRLGGTALVRSRRWLTPLGPAY